MWRRREGDEKDSMLKQTGEKSCFRHGPPTYRRLESLFSRVSSPPVMSKMELHSQNRSSLNKEPEGTVSVWLYLLSQLTHLSLCSPISPRMTVVFPAVLSWTCRHTCQAYTQLCLADTRSHDFFSHWDIPDTMFANLEEYSDNGGFSPALLPCHREILVQEILEILLHATWSAVVPASQGKGTRVSLATHERMQEKSRRLTHGCVINIAPVHCCMPLTVIVFIIIYYVMLLQNWLVGLFFSVVFLFNPENRFYYKALTSLQLMILVLWPPKY